MAIVIPSAVRAISPDLSPDRTADRSSVPGGTGPAPVPPGPWPTLGNSTWPNEGGTVDDPPNILLILLDTLRADAAWESLGRSDRTLTARRCIASAPWTLPSCTAMLNATSSAHLGNYWRNPPSPRNPLLDALPRRYRKIGVVNNSALSKGSGAELGFDRWTFIGDHDAPFERALRVIDKAGRRRPCFLLLHSNIAHDHGFAVSSRYLPPGAPRGLGERIITWRDTTPEDRTDAVTRYQACVAALVEKVRAVLDAVRQRDDFVTAVTADHGEGFDYELGRLHHGGRVHQDLLQVPLLFDLPSTIATGRRQALGDALESQTVSTTDILPTLFGLAGLDDLPDVDGSPIDRVGARTLVSEDKRYLYLRDRFRINYRGKHGRMTAEELQRNADLLSLLDGGPTLRSFIRGSDKLIVTSFRVASTTDGGVDRSALLGLGRQLLGTPSLHIVEDQLFAFERFDLDADPLEQRNLLAETPEWTRELLGGPWRTEASMPGPGGTPMDLASIFATGETIPDVEV